MERVGRFVTQPKGNETTQPVVNGEMNGIVYPQTEAIIMGACNFKPFYRLCSPPI
jgi:hypothetical protein